MAHDLAAVEDGLLDVRDGTLVQPHELLVATIEFVAAGELFNFGEVGDCVEGDEVEDDEGRLHERAKWVGLHVAVCKGEPALEKSLDFFQAEAGGGGGEGAAARHRHGRVGKAGE